MSVTVRRYRRGGWELDIRLEWSDGTETRERRKAPVSTKTEAARWGRQREQYLLRHPPTRSETAETTKEVPTLDEFAPRFVTDYAEANQQKRSGVHAKKMILRVHLGPFLGNKKLDAITTGDVQGLKARLAGRAPKTVNNVLTVLSKLLKVAVEWEVISQMPCSIRLLRGPKPSMSFYDFDEYRSLVEAASRVGRQAHLLVLLGGDAGLRSGEKQALRWTDVDLARRHLTVRQSTWQSYTDAPKGGRSRCVPLTERLVVALNEHRHLRGSHVVCQRTGTPLSEKMATRLVIQATREAGVEKGQPHHILRHTFCSHLAMRGVPVRVIQELAGHASLSTTLRYMHLSPGALDGAIRKLEQPPPEFGDIVETVGR